MLGYKIIMTLLKFLTKHKTQLSDKQIECLTMVFDRIIQKSNELPDYLLLDKQIKREFMISLVELDEQLWIYIVKQTLKYEKLYAFS